MRILGIVAEYDPFHRGHEKHLQQAKARVEPDFTWVVMSGCWKQRGEAAMLSPSDRARCALAAGADAVFLLPEAWTVREAEHYALGSVSLLAGLGVTHLAFGAETETLPALRRIAETLENPSEIFSGQLRQNLDRGWGYPKAVAEALGIVQPAWKKILNSPNNTLAVCYLRAIQRLKREITPVLILRKGDYHGETIDPAEPSASALRSAVSRGNYREAFEAVPPVTEQMIRQAMAEHRLLNQKTLDHLMIHRLRSMKADEIRSLPDVSEGLEQRILHAAGSCRTREEIITAVSGSRYPKARISRICTWALIGGMTREEAERLPLPGETVLLGLRRNRRMTALWRQSPIRIYSSMKDTENSPLWLADRRGWNLWNLCAGLDRDAFCGQRIAVWPESTPEKGETEPLS